MTCRTIAGGSLTTTFVQREFGLTDAQSTSLFHSLRRHARGQGLSVPAREYRQAIDAIESGILASPATPGLQARALDRVARARADGLPADPAEAWAVTRMTTQASATRQFLDSLVVAAAIRTGLPAEDIRQEWDYQYERALRADARRLPALPDGLPNDPGTRWAAHMLRHGERCSVCGRFASPTVVHTCPPSLADWRTDRPATPAGPRGDGIAAPEIYSVLDHDDHAGPVDPFAVAEPQAAPAVPDGTEALDAPFVPVEGGWASDMAGFQDVYDKARERIEEGQTRVPTFAALEAVPGGVTGGLAGPDGTTFGLEIEIDFPDDAYPYSRRYELAQRLYAEGIAQTPNAERWHYVGGEGQNRLGGQYVEDPDAWVCEFDRTVDDVEGERGVEIKSMILRDDPRTWHNLRRICEIAEELGGRATSRTGLHVNVGGDGFATDDPTAHLRLLRLTAAFDDTMIRMATNPESGEEHRGRGYCRPVEPPPAGFTSVSQAQQYADHYSAVNLGHLPAEGERRRSDSRIEMRIFDSTLDPGRIQASVNLALGLVAAARSGQAPGGAPMRAGTTRREYGSRRLSGERWEQATEPFRRLMDILGRQGLDRPEHREQLTHLFAAARWPRS